MPLYEYKCDRCGIVREIQQKLDEKPNIVCPMFEKTMCVGLMIKIMSAGSFSLKGKGWSRDGYSKGGK